MLIFDPVEAEVDANVRFRAFAADALDHAQRALGQHAIRWDRDHFGLAMLIRADYKFIEILSQEGFAAGEGHVKGRLAKAGKDAVPLFDGEIIVGFAPDIASATLAVAAIAHANDDRKGFDFRPAEGAKGPVHG